MDAVALALGASLFWGASNFIAGMGARHASGLAVAFWANLLLLPAVVVLALVVPGQFSLGDIGWGVAAAIPSVAALALVFTALAHGRMALIAPLTTMAESGGPALVGLVVATSTSSLTIVGLVGVVIAATLISMGAATEVAHVTTTIAQDVRRALLVGTGFAFYVIVLANASDESGMWPLVGVQFASVVELWLYAKLRRRTLRVPREAMRFSFFVGVCLVVANLCYLLASMWGSLAVVGTLSCLSAVPVVILAKVVDGQSFTTKQLAGFIVGVAGLMLIGAAV